MDGFSKRRVYLLFFLFGFIIILLNFFISYWNLGNSIDKDFVNDSKKTLEFNESQIKSRITHYTHELETISQSPFVSKFVEAYLQDDKELVRTNTQYFIDLVKAHEDIMKVRYISNDGNEIIRAEREDIGSNPKIVAEDDLQNKKDRSYYQQVQITSEGNIYYSEIDLNVEHAKTEIPYKPTLRLGIPVFVKGERQGMIIINLFMKDLLQELQVSGNYQLYLVDMKGNFLFHSDPKYNWSAYLEKKHTLFDEFPEIASMILTNKFYSNKQIFSKEFDFGQSTKYYLIAKLSSSSINKLKKELIEESLMIGFLIMVITFPFGLIIVRQIEHLSVKLTAVVDSLGDGIFILDKEGHTSYVNNKTLELLEYSSNELLGNNNHKLLKHGNDKCKYIKEEDCPIHNVNKTQQQSYGDNNTFVTKSGKCINIDYITTPFYVDGYFEGSVTIFRDISNKKILESEQKLLEKELKYSEEKYRNLIENAVTGVLKINDKGIVIYANDALIKMLEYPDQKSLYGTDINRIFKNIKDKNQFFSLLKKKKYVDSYSLLLKTFKGENINVIISALYDEGIISGMMVDMSAATKAEQEIEKLSTVLEQIDDIVTITDVKGVLTYVNEAFCKFTGYSREEAIGETPKLYKSSKHTSLEMQELWATILDGKVYRGVIINKKKNGELFYEEKTITPLYNDKGELIYFVSTGKDITERVEMGIKLEKLATTDYLTGLYNRFKFEEIFNEELIRSERYNSALSIIMFDIDHFKNINDKFGHDIGDRVLKEVSKLVSSHIRKSDILSRWGGEEFMLLTPELDLHSAYILAEKIRLEISGFDFTGVGHVTCSLGVTQFQKDDECSLMYKRVDKAMYTAKEGGRNRTEKN